jgi:uncharacterized protein (TIGR03437 family)
MIKWFQQMSRFSLSLALAALTVPISAQDTDIRLVRVASGLGNPTDIQHAGDGSDRLFVAHQAGEIRIIRGGSVLSTPFLNIRSKTRGQGECGLLGVAFPPNFSTKQYFYVNYTDPACRQSVVARYRVTSDPNVADANNEEVILTLAQPYQNHNGGQIQFGPDGFLYIGFGDGGSGGDPQNNGQVRNTLLGKILRIDVESDTTPYRVPPSNPFVNQAGTRPEIWALGLRNPWRFSFDRLTGDMWMGDVGQDRAEEVNFQPASSRGGENYGWRQMEGQRCFVQGCDASSFVSPILEYTRGQGDVSVTGGYVYRGSRSSNLAATYFYGDYSSGRIWGVRREGAQFSNRFLLRAGFNISTFGEDQSGEIYVADHSGGVIYRIEGPPEPVVPRFTANSVVNAASFEPGLTPGSLATVFASGITDGPVVTPAPRVPLPRELSGVRVIVGGVEAPIHGVANVNGQEQINFQVPFETSGPAAAMIVRRDAQSSASVVVPVFAVQPGVYTSNNTDAIVVRNSDNTLVTTQRPLARGEYAYFYMTGLGSVDNAPRTGEGGPRSPLATVRVVPSVTIGGVSCDVVFAGLAPDFVGVYQVNILVAAAVPPGNQDLVVTSGQLRSRAVKVLLQ